jgi:hypothetical protein
LVNAMGNNSIGAQSSARRMGDTLTIVLQLLAGRRLWVIGTRQRRFNSAPRSIPRWCNVSTLGNSTVAFLSAYF